MIPVILEMRRFGASAMIALLFASAITSSDSLASMADSTVTSKLGNRVSRRVDAINAGNYSAYLPGAITLLSPTLSPELEMLATLPLNVGPQGLGKFVPMSPFDTDIVLQRGSADDNCRVLYRSDFDSPFQKTLRNEWSYGDVRETPQGRRFLGTIGNGSTTLTVAQAPKNGDFVIQFDVLAIGQWQGNKTATGTPEVWGVKVVDGPVLAETNFATIPGATQSYPDSVGRSQFEAGYQALETFKTADGNSATVYRLTYRFNRAASATESGTDDVRIEFFARGLAGEHAPAWGLTNVVLALIPDSGGMGGGGGTNKYDGNWGGFVAGFQPNGFGLMPPGASGSKTSSAPAQAARPTNDQDPGWTEPDTTPHPPTPPAPSENQVPAPGSLLVLAASGLLGIKRKR
ncbi:MAG: hypothetical protein ACREJD_17195 [Phycisphaerales bacterium]